MHNEQWTRHKISARFIVYGAFCILDLAFSVSVVIPTFNRAPLLRETLASVRGQTRAAFEILVVDDGSTDDTAEMLAREFPQVQVHRIAHAGQGAARNAGIAQARGDALAFLDSDDVWDAHFIERTSAALQNSPHAGFAYCDYGMFEEGRTLQTHMLAREYKHGGDLFPPLLESDFLCTGALLIRRACFETVGVFDPALPPVEDWDMWLRLARQYQAVYVDAPLVQIRVNLTHASRNPQIVYARNLELVRKLRREFPGDARRYRRELRRHEKQFHLALANCFRVKRRPLSALKHYAHFFAARLLG